MSFTIFKMPELSHESRAPYLPNFGTLPIFYIDGILGLNHGFNKIAETLYQLSGDQREIYCYQDKRNQLTQNHDGGFPASMYLSLDEQATLIADAICDNAADLKKSNYQNVPIMIAAYSYGCTLSPLVTNKIVERYPNAKITLYMIDGATPESAAHYFHHNSIEMNLNLIEVINYACVNAGYSQLLPQDNKSIAALLKEKSFEDKFTYLDKLVKDLNQDTSEIKIHNRFNTYFTMLKNDLMEIYNNNQPDDDILAESIKLIVTKKTSKRYGDSHLGWPKEKAKLVLQNKLVDVAHTQLLSHESSAIIAENLHHATDYIERCAAQKYIGDPLDYSDDDTYSDNAPNANSNEENAYEISESPPEEIDELLLDNDSQNETAHQKPLSFNPSNLSKKLIQEINQHQPSYNARFFPNPRTAAITMANRKNDKRPSL